MSNSKPSDGKYATEARRLIKAFGHSIDGFKAIAKHPAFQIELIVASVAIPVAIFAGRNGVERALLIGSIVLVLIVESLNTGIEKAIDRISQELHPLSKLAKDVGSCAVLLSIINAAVVWFFIVMT